MSGLNDGSKEDSDKKSALDNAELPLEGSKIGKKVVFFGHHKCGSRFFRSSILPAFAEANNYAEIQYKVKSPPFHHRNPVDLDLYNLELSNLTTEENSILYVANAGAFIVDKINKINPRHRGLRILRDPRQIVVSCYFHHLKGHDTHFRGWVWDQLVEDRYVMEHLNLEEGLIYEIENISGCILRDQIFAWQPRDNVLEIRLEEINSDFERVMGTIAEFLEFEEMPVLESDKVARFENPKSRHWSTVFTPRVKQIFKDKFGENLIQLGYEKNLRW